MTLITMYWPRRLKVRKILGEAAFGEELSRLTDQLLLLIDQYADEKVEKAREEQIMQDELSLSDFDIDESQIIQWRIDRLESLKKEKL